MTQTKSLDVRVLFHEALGVIFKRKKLILGLFLIVALGISFAVLSIPNSYEVTGKLVVTRSRGDLLVSPSDPKNFNFMVTAPTIQDMAVHAELLKNRSLLESVARKLNLDRPKTEAREGSTAEANTAAEANTKAEASTKAEANAQAAQAAAPVPASLVPFTSAGPSRLDSAIDSINTGLTVQVLPNSNLILVKYRSSDPVKGAAILNTLLDLYLAQYVKLHEKSGVADFFTEHRDRFSDKLKRSESDLRRFQEQAGLLSAAVQVDPFSRRYVESLSNYVDSQWDLKEAEARVEALKARLAETPERVQRMSTVKLNPMLQTLQQSLLQLEMQRRQLLALYTDNDRRVTDINTQIEAVKKQVAETSEYVPDVQETELNQVRRDLEEKLFAGQMNVVKNKIRNQNAQQMVADMKAELHTMGQNEVEKERLIREVQANSDSYLLYRKKTEEARITDAMDQSRIMNVAIGERAARQGTPVGPPKNLSLLFAVMVGLVSGVGAAFLREFFDGSVKSEREIRETVDLPVLGTIPEERAGKKNGNGNGKKNGNGNGNGKKNGNGINGH